MLKLITLITILMIVNTFPAVAETSYSIIKEYYKSGKLERETPYVNGKRNGVEKYYFESGALHLEVPYVNGKVDGVEKVYYESGVLAYKRIFESNVLIKDSIEFVYDLTFRNPLMIVSVFEKDGLTHITTYRNNMFVTLDMRLQFADNGKPLKYLDQSRYPILNKEYFPIWHLNVPDWDLKEYVQRQYNDLLKERVIEVDCGKYLCKLRLIPNNPLLKKDIK